MDQGPDHSVFFVILGIPALVGLGIWLTRRLVVRKVQQMMMAASGVAERPATLAAPAADVAATRALQWQLVSASSPQEGAASAREAPYARAMADFSSAFRHELAIAAAYVLIPLAVYAWPGENTLDGGTVAAMTMLLGGLTLPFLALMRYLGFRSQFRAYVSGLAGVFRPFATTWLEIARPRWRALQWGGVLALAALSVALALGDYTLAPRTALAFSLVIAAHLFLAWRLMAKARQTPNLKLLVLRVFGIDDAALFTFEGLLQYWRHFGTFFTVVDPTFLHSQFRQGAALLYGVIGSGGVTLVVLSGMKNESIGLGLLLLAVALAATALYGYAHLRQTERQFLRSADDVAANLQRLDAWPRHLDLSFKSLPMMCHDNVWKHAVSQGAQASAAVLMDLRGFSSERKGCQYEVNFLLDNVPLERIVFLIDTPDEARVKALILECWALLSPTSPNLAATAPTVTLYMASVQDAKDIQGILDQLLLATQAGGGSAQA